MKAKGVDYDAGAYLRMNWRPRFVLDAVRQEMRIIREDLHCNAVRMTARDPERLVPGSQAALDQGLDVWYNPVVWDRTPQETLERLGKAAAAAESLRVRWPDRRVVFVARGGLTLFMKGIVPGKNLRSRLASPELMPMVKAGRHNAPLNAFLQKASASVRSSFHGPVTYASLVWEGVDWGPFDCVGVDHYRNAKVEDRYLDMLRPSFSCGKPVVVTEFGYPTTHGAWGEGGFLGTAGLSGDIVGRKSQFFHQRLPGLGRLFRPSIRGDHSRDEKWQAEKLVETLSILDGAGVEGAFVSTFEAQIARRTDDPRHDLDMSAMSLVKYYEGGRRGRHIPRCPGSPRRRSVRSPTTVPPTRVGAQAF